MKLFLDTSTSTCNLTLANKNGTKNDYSWEAGRGLAKGLHAFIQEKLQLHNIEWRDIDGIGVYKGPGSYTGLRIGLTVMNTLADSLEVPIVGAHGDGWQDVAVKRLNNGENDKIILPEYGGTANITSPRK